MFYIQYFLISKFFKRFLGIYKDGKPRLTEWKYWESIL